MAELDVAPVLIPIFGFGPPAVSITSLTSAGVPITAAPAVVPITADTAKVVLIITSIPGFPFVLPFTF